MDDVGLLPLGTKWRVEARGAESWEDWNLTVFL